MSIKSSSAFVAGIVIAGAGFFGINACIPAEEAPEPQPQFIAEVPEVDLTMTPEPPADPRAQLAEDFASDGMTVGDVIICPEGFSVSTDTTPDGITWAACM